MSIDAGDIPEAQATQVPAQLREFVLEQMVAERFKVGDALPAEGALAESLGVGRGILFGRHWETWCGKASSKEFKARGRS